MEKDEKRELMLQQKRKTLRKNKSLVTKYYSKFLQNFQMDCDLAEDKIWIKFCHKEDDIQLWHAFQHLTSSLPYKGAVGRQTKLFIMCKDHVLGMVHLTSATCVIQVRDEFLQWDLKKKWDDRRINQIYNIQTCVPFPKYAPVLTGKLLVYAVFSTKVKRFLEKKYKEPVLGFETTSLYGKSSMYNRIPFLKYLGLTKGYTSMYVPEEKWKDIVKEHRKIFPTRKRDRKYQKLDHLRKYYEKNNMVWPYENKDVNFRRGVYFGYMNDTSLKKRVKEWRERWYLPRKQRIESGEVKLETVVDAKAHIEKMQNMFAATTQFGNIRSYLGSK